MAILPLAALALIPVMLTELHLFSIHDLVGATVPDTIFFEHAAQGLMQGHLPYGANFLTAPDSSLVFVYPPISLLLAIPPLLAGSRYSLGLALEMLLLLGAGLWLLDRYRRQAGVAFPIALASAALLLALGPLVVTRMDGIQGLALAGAALALRSRRLALAVGLVALAALVKETVVVALLPVVLWALWPEQGHRWAQGLGRRTASVALGLLPAAVLLGIFGVWSKGRVLSAAITSVHRGVEVESFPATISYLTHWIWPVTVYTGRLGSQQISGRQVSLVAGVLVVSGAAALVWATVRLVRERRRPAAAMAVAIAIALVTTPVLSPQYLLALMPVLVLAAATEFGGARANRLLLLGAAVALLTQVEFPYLFGSVVSLSPVGMGIVAVRNLLLMAIAVGLVRSDPGPSLQPASSQAVSPGTALAG